MEGALKVKGFEGRPREKKIRWESKTTERACGSRDTWGKTRNCRMRIKSVYKDTSRTNRRRKLGGGMKHKKNRRNKDVPLAQTPAL
jgi:hypothetical protein